MKSDHLLKLTSDFGLKICQTNCGIHVVFKSEINHLQKNVPAPKTTSPSATKTDGIQYDLKHIHHEIKPCKTLINNHTKKNNHLPTSPNLSRFFFLWCPSFPPFPQLAPVPVSWRHGTVDFDTTTTWALWSSNAHRP